MVYNIAAGKISSLEIVDEENCELLLKSVIPSIDFMRIDQMDLQGLSYFHVATAHNCLDIVGTLLVRESVPVMIDISVSDDHPRFPGYTALHFAAANGHLDTVDLLLKHKANLNMQDVEGSTALHLAYYRSFEQIVQRILSSCKDNFEVCPTDGKGLSHFHISCMDGPTDIVRGFVHAGSIDIEAKISSNAESWPGCTALHIAAEYESSEIVEILLKADADPNQVNASGMTPLHLVCRLSSLKADMVKASLMRKDNSQRVVDLITARAQESIVSLLLDHEADPNIKDSTGKTPILYLYDYAAFSTFKKFKMPWYRSTFSHFSVLRDRRSSIVNLLLNNGSDVHVADDDGFTLLHHLAEWSQEDFNTRNIAENLVKEGVDIDARTKSGKTPLFFASKFRLGWPMVVFLLENGADPNAAEYDMNSTPFVNYMLNSRSDVLTKFVENGADLHHQLKNGKTVLHVLFSRSKDCGYVAKSSQSQRMVVQTLDQIPKILGTEGCIDVQDSTGRTALHYACLRNDAEDVKILISYGAAIDIEDNEGKTPFECCTDVGALTHAARYAKILKKAGVPFNKACIEVIEEINSAYQTNEEEQMQEAKEITRLQKIKLDRYNTMYDLIFKRPSELIKHIKNPDVSWYLSCGDAPKVLPKFGGVLLYQYRKGISRQKLSEPARNALTSLSKQNLPDCCWDQVLDCLDNASVKSLISGAPY